jgi:hypothetical protein
MSERATGSNGRRQTHLWWEEKRGRWERRRRSESGDEGMAGEKTALAGGVSGSGATYGFGKGLAKSGNEII